MKNASARVSLNIARSDMCFATQYRKIPPGIRFPAIANVVPGGLFLYWIANHMSLRAMLSDTLAVAFFIDLVMSMLFLSYLFARKPVGRVKWPWLVVATLLGTLAFGVPLFLWLNWRLLPRPRPDFDEWWRAA